jgi:RimJ/RimL family protein N-acetyltransferase
MIFMTVTQTQVIATGTIVRLRAKQIEDAENDYAWRCDPELAAYDAARPLRASFKTFVSTMREDLNYPTMHRRTFAIEDLDGERHIGNVMYYGYDQRAGEAELGITIGERDFWSSGYGTDSVRTLVEYLFREIGLTRVYLHTLSWNYRAQRCFEHAGFQHVQEVQRGGYEFILMEIEPDNAPDK